MGRFVSLMGCVKHCYHILGSDVAQNIVDLVKDIPAAGAKYLQLLSRQLPPENPIKSPAEL